MAEVQKPLVADTPAIAEPAPAPVTETPALETKAEEAAATEPAAETPAEAVPAAEEKTTKVEKPVEPIYSGALGYKAPGLKNAFRFAKKYFWFGEEPVSAQSLSTYLRGEKPEVAQPTVAWSTQTGKGLLYFVKHADQKATPAGVLNLADATELSKDGTIAFHFKLHGGKHTFEASTAPERNGWFIAVEKAVADAKDAKKQLVETPGYKEQLEKLGKPATLAVASTSAAKEAVPKKSTEVRPTEPTLARTGTSSSSSSDNEEKRKKNASKSKSRSVSRGKRGSVFGTLLGKKEKLEEKKEEKKEEKEEKKAEKAAEEAAPSTALAPTIAPADTTVHRLEAAPVIETPTEETAAPAAEATEATKAEEPVVPATETVETKPKPVKRGSIFGNFVEKLRSPTHEKKESEVAPPVPAKEETPTVAPKIEESAAPVLAAEAAEEPKVEETPKTEIPATTTTATGTTPRKEKESFSFSKFFPKEKARTPTTETPATVKPEAEVPKAEEIPAVVEPTAAPTEELKPEEPLKEETTPTASKAKRGSIFGNLTNGKKEKSTEGEVAEPKKENKLTGLFRSASKSAKPLNKKSEKEPVTPALVEEADEPKIEEPAATEATPAVAEPTSEPKIIGDVVPDAVTVGQAHKSTPEVSATA